MITYLTFAVHHDEPVRDLAEKAAGRIYTIDGVDDVEIRSDFAALELPVQLQSNGHGD